MSAPSETRVGIVDDDQSVQKGLARLIKSAWYRVKVHRARVMEKMRAGSLAELVRLADRAGSIAKP